MRVLIVDDDPDDRFLIREALARGGFEVVQAGSAEEGFRIARESAPDALLADTNMPRMGGLELIGRLRGEPAMRGVPMLLMSSTAQGPDADAAEAAGVTLLRKPLLEAEYLEFAQALRATLAHAKEV